MPSFLETGIRESGYRYEGSDLSEMLDKETTPNVRSQQNGMLVKDILGEVIISLSNRLSFGDDGVELVTLREEDICQPAGLFVDPLTKPTKTVTMNNPTLVKISKTLSDNCLGLN